MKRQGIKKDTPYDFKKVIGVINYYDRFMESVANHPDEELLKTAFYLFHLNHYAKKYQEQSKDLYALKNQVIRKMYQTNPDKIEAILFSRRTAKRYGCVKIARILHAPLESLMFPLYAKNTTAPNVSYNQGKGILFSG